MRRYLVLPAKCFLSLFIVVMISCNGYAQSNDSTNFIQKNIRISGNATVFGQLYNMSGRSGRRPPSTGRLMIDPTITLFNYFSIPIQILVSTEGSYARQNINQYGINPSWGWGTLHLGDFSESYSPLTLSGITIRGAGIDLHPGIFRFSTVAGYTQRAVAGGAGNGSYSRFLYASKLGLGPEHGTHLDLILVRAKDKVNSLSNNEPTITVISPNGGDEIPLNSVQTIRWNSTDISGPVKIELSRDGGDTYETLFTDQPSSGSVIWNVTGMETFQALIKVTSESDSTVFDVSDQPFTIAAGVTYSKGDVYPNFSNPYAVTPKGNLVMGMSGKAGMFHNIISLNFEASGSAYTKDLRASELDLNSYKVPGFIKGLYTPRLSSSFDYALNSGLNLNLRNFNAKFGYQYIGPGYKSLGLSYLSNDQQRFSAMTSLRISKFNIHFSWSRFNDNLISQKQFTTVRNHYGANLSGMLTHFWNISLVTNVMNMDNNSSNDTTKVNFSNLVISTNNSFIIKKSVLRGIIINYTYQNNNSMMLESTKSNIQSLNFGLRFAISKNLNANTSMGLISSTLNDTTRHSTQMYSASLQYRALKNKLVSSVSFSASSLQNNNSFRMSLTSGYSLTKKDRISLRISMMNYKSMNPENNSFHEFISSLDISHQF